MDLLANLLMQVLLGLVAAGAPGGSGADSPRSSNAEAGPYRCCGLNCLMLVAHFRDVAVPFKELEQLIRPRPNGECSVADIERAATAIGLGPVCAQVSWNHLPDLPPPCIVQLHSATRYATGGHYAILMGLHEKGVILLDAPSPARLHPYQEFQKDWTGVVIACPVDEAARREFLAKLVPASAWGPARIGAVAFAAAVVVTSVIASRWSRASLVRS